MKGTILVPLDGTRLSESALPCALHLAARSDNKLVVVRAIDPMAGFVPGMSPAASEVIRHQYRRLAEDYLEKIRRGHPAEVSTQLVNGRPSTEIVRAVRSHGCRLIVMASHGHSGAARWFLGSVAEQVLRRSPCPVLLLRPPSPPVSRFRHVLVPIDGSPASLKVPGWLPPFLVPGARVSLVHVSDDWVRHNLPDLAEEHGACLNRLADQLRQIQVPTAEVHLDFLEGKPAVVLSDWAAEHGCDLIALSSHGRSGFRRFWLGSVAAKLARHSACPLLVFPLRWSEPPG